MNNNKISKCGIIEIRDIVLQKNSSIHTFGPVLEPGNWKKNDPFLIMMEDKFQRGAFDVHPHRGMETVTYVIDGAIEHYDSYTGESGILGVGDVQWMTAGSGVVHNEVPPEGVVTHSLQLWVNLPRKKKMTTPRYQNLKRDDMPVRKEKGALIRVFSGSSKDVVATTLNHVPVTMVEVIMEQGASVAQNFPSSYNGFIYILEGSGMFGINKVTASKGQVLWLDTDKRSQESEIEMTANEPLRLLIYAGEPLNEPVVARGPFVMNTEEDIFQAYQEFKQGTFLKH